MRGFIGPLILLLTATTVGCGSKDDPPGKPPGVGGSVKKAGAAAPPRREPHVKLIGHAGGVESVAFSPDGKSIATASLDRSVRLWDPRTGKERLRLLGHTDSVYRVTFSPDGKTLASAGSDGTIRLWDPTSGKDLAVLEGRGGGGLAFSPDGTLLARGDPVTVWNLATRKVRYVIPEAPFRFDVMGTQLAFSPDGKYLAGKCSDGVVRVWDAVNGLERFEFKGHGGYAYAAAFTCDGRLLASAGTERTDKLSDPAVARGLSIFDGYYGHVDSLVLSPDGRLLIAREFTRFTIWDVSTRTLRGTLPATVEYEGFQLPLAIRTIAISPDGNTLATAMDAGFVALWDVDRAK